MKSVFLPIFLFLFLFNFERTAAQKNRNEFQRCATMDRLKLYENNNLLYRTNNEAKAKEISTLQNAGQFRLQAITTIPVVVHIVMPNPFLISDADVQAQIDRLNQDFSGLNADSTNGANFYPVRGHSQIRFCLARRTPAGLMTNGIERRSSLVGSDVNAAADPIKRTSQGGLDSWNTAQYLNLWIGQDQTGQGILGYADNIGPGTSADDGVFLNFQAFGSSSCYTIPQYNRGRTATHEVGHYLGLYHIWADDNGGCGGDDFAQLPASTSCSLPTGLFNPTGQGNGTADVGDTPNQGNATTSCPTGTASDACSAVAPGKMYQNHMDYTQDACLSMFSNKQVARMEWILENCRTGLKTSPGCQPPSGAISLDVAPLTSVNPGGYEINGCQTVYYTDSLSCPGTIIPKFRVVNNGQTTITSLTVGYSYDGGAPVTQTVPVNIPQGGSYVASFTPIPVTTGSHLLRFFTANPNGAADQVSSNDSYTKSFVVMTPTAPPLFERFETASPFVNWAIDNPNLDFTWTRTTPGRESSAGKLSINNFNYDGYGNKDDFRSTTINVDPTQPYVLSFDLAHKNYPDAAYSDTLAVLISGDCGQTFTRVYHKGGANLATAGSSQSSYAVPGVNDWRTESISLSGALISTGKIIVIFRNISGYGNFIHLDNINLVKIGARDLQVSAILSPGTTACSGVLNPSVTVENVGMEAVTSFSVGYRVDNGSLQQQNFTQTIAPGASVTVTLPQFTTTSGQHTLTAFSFNPVTVSGTGDSRLSNDTLRKSFSVVHLAAPSIVEGFETAFPPSGWTINNPDNNVTWRRKMPGRNSQYSAFFDNFDNDAVDQRDDLMTPFLDVAGADSVLVSFDVAHKFYPNSTGPSNDRLSVLATTNCSNSFSTVYSKSGSALATAGSTIDAYISPVAGDWRRERILLEAPALQSGSLGLAFRNTNDFGNNIFLDNISIAAVYKRDIQLLSIQQPGSFVCLPNVTPAVTVRNNGTDTVKSFRIVYTINNGTAVSHTVSGLSLARGAEMSVSLPAVTNLTPGSYTFRVNSTELITSKGAGDLYLRNDTLTLVFAVPGTVSAPLVESFTNTVFPPVNWNVVNPDGSFTWQYYPGGNGNQGAAFVRTFGYTTLGQTDVLASPMIKYENVDSVKLNFDLAAATYSYPGSTGVPLDTLEVLVTRDCGNSFTTVYKKWGYELQTIGDPNTPQTDEFFPQAANDWRTETIDLSLFAAQSPVMVFFKLTNNNENNLFIDNIRFNTRILPAQLKERGYLIYPVPFHNDFTVWHYQTPANLKSIRVINAAGQTVWTKQFNGNGTKQERVDLTGKSAGLYVVEIGYADGKKTASQKIIKE